MTNPPEGLIIESGLPDHIKVRVRGPKGLVRSLVEKTLTYPLDISNLEVGESVVDIREDRVPLSAAFDIVEIKPNRLVLKVDRMASKDIRVEAGWKGTINPDYELSRAEVEPDMVELRGPETVLRKISFNKVIVREDFSEEVPSLWEREVALDLPASVEASPGQVKAILHFSPKMRQIWVKIPLTVQSPEGIRVKPRQDYVRLLLEGPVYLFRDRQFRNDVAAVIKVGEDARAGKYEMGYTVLLPDDCRLERKNPETISLTIR
jgi:YbbR domain-containing protein